MENVQVALPVVNLSNQLHLKRYFDAKQQDIWYDITFTIKRYSSNKISLHIDVREEEGYYPCKKEYFFNIISSIKKEYSENNEHSLSITFVTLLESTNHVSNYKYSRFSSKHADALHQFLIDNIM
jgi:hypothetical protein